MRLLRSLVLGLAIPLGLTTASAQTLAVSPSGLFANGGVSGFTIGYEFTVSSPFLVTSLGYWDQLSNGLAASHQVGLWSSTGTLLSSAIVAGGNSAPLLGEFRMVDVSPFLLAVGTYRVGGTIDGDPYGFAGSVITTAPGITYDGYAYCPAAVLTDPSCSLGTPNGNIAYFGGNFAGTATVTPEPASMTLLATGLAGVFGAARRRRSRTI